MKQLLHSLLNIKEAYEMPDKLLSIMLDDSKRIFFLERLHNNCDLSFDCFRDYFQAEHGDRESLKQDYTPDCICNLIEKLHKPTARKLLDVCCGTGALTLSVMKNTAFEKIQCEELSSRAVPVLLCNLSLRNVTAIVKQTDVITKETQRIYQISENERFSNIKIADDFKEEKFDLIISNPPYSLNWNPPSPIEATAQERFSGYDIPPKSKADYVFILDILSRLSSDGEAFVILPHGVLFRGATEGKIRQKLIENNYIDAVIGLPEKLFLNTSIPVFVLVLKKNRNCNDVLFIDASKQFVKSGKQNSMSDDHINNVLSAYISRKEIKKLSSVATIDKIRENDYNLNIPRYVDTFDPPETVDIDHVLTELVRLDNEIKATNNEIYQMMKQLSGIPDDTFRKLTEYFGGKND